MYFSRQVWTTWWVSSRDILRATVEVSNQLFCNSSPSIHQIHAFWEKRLLCGWSLKSCSYVKKQSEVIPSWWQVSVNVICSLLSSIRSFENWSFDRLSDWLLDYLWESNGKLSSLPFYTPWHREYVIITLKNSTNKSNNLAVTTTLLQQYFCSLKISFLALHVFITFHFSHALEIASYYSNTTYHFFKKLLNQRRAAEKVII